MGGDDIRTSRLVAIDAAVSDWRQGDCVVGEQWFAHAFLPAMPITDAAVAAANAGVALVESPAKGFAVLTQTCDIVRPCADRPYVETAPLEVVAPERLVHIARGMLPRLALVPGVADRHLVADLDRVLTVEEAVLTGWNRVAGCRSDAEARAFADALARKRSRFAFPDDLTK